jgi:hypothetical protein
MTTVVTTSNSEVATPASYISRWIAQSHGTYQKRANEFYSSSPSCDCRSPSDAQLHSTPTMANGHSHTTTWQAQARSRFDATVTTLTGTSSYHDHDNELHEKLQRITCTLPSPIPVRLMTTSVRFLCMPARRFRTLLMQTEVFNQKHQYSIGRKAFLSRSRSSGIQLG